MRLPIQVLTPTSVCVPHYEAPVKLAYSAKTVLLRFVSHTLLPLKVAVSRPVSQIQLLTPYLVSAALLMAGLDGVQNKIHPGEPASKNLYDLPLKKMHKSQPFVPA